MMVRAARLELAVCWFQTSRNNHYPTPLSVLFWSAEVELNQTYLSVISRVQIPLCFLRNCFGGEVEESNPGPCDPPGIQNRLPTIQRYLPFVC